MPQPGRVPKPFVFVAFITEERFVQRKTCKEPHYPKQARGFADMWPCPNVPGDIWSTPKAP